MKAKPEDVGARLDQPGDIRLFLLHGPDEAGAAALAARLGKAMGDDAERIDLEPGQLRSRPGLLADEAASLSLFGGRRHLRVTGAGEEILEAVTLLLAAEQAGNPAVVLAPAIKTSGKLAKLVGDARQAVAVACYVPEGPAAVRMAQAAGRDAGVRLGNDVAALLVDAANGDRAILAREIEKLALFLDASPSEPREATTDALAAIGASREEDGIGDAVAALVAADPAALGAALDGLAQSGSSGIPWLRAAIRRLIALAEMRADVDRGDSASRVVERHRVFWKEKDATLDALRRWDAARIARAIERLRAAERASMKGDAVGEVLTGQAALTIARGMRR